MQTRNELKITMKADALLYPKLSGNLLSRVKNMLVTNPINSQHKIFQYVRALRLAEYHENNSYIKKNMGAKALYHTIVVLWYYFILRQLSYKTGIQIPPNVCGAGLQIWHYGYIIINSKTKIGKNLTIYPGVEIGHKIPGGKCPTIGDNCFVASGVKIFGDVHIGNNVTIAANSVVTKDVPDNAVVGGAPAKIIRMKNENSTN